MPTEDLFNETRLLFHALKHWAESLHPERGITVAMRAVLELLLLGGPATVPDMGRARGVSRQHIQQQVDGLLERGLVRRQHNPAHKRSTLIELTDEGRGFIQGLRAEEQATLSRLRPGVSDRAMQDATQVLCAWRIALQQDAERRNR